MKTVKNIRCFLVVAGCLLAAGITETAAQPKYRVLISGAGLNYVAIIDEDGNEEWRHAVAGTRIQGNDSWPLPNGNIIVAYMQGVRIIKPDFDNPDKVPTMVSWRNSQQEDLRILVHVEFRISLMPDLVRFWESPV